MRKAASASTPVVEISESEGVWSIKTSTAVKTHTVKFKVSVTMRLNPELLSFMECDKLSIKEAVKYILPCS